MTTKFEVNRNVKTDKKRKHKPKSDESEITLEDRKIKLDHRQINKIPILDIKLDNKIIAQTEGHIRRLVV